MSPRYRKHEWGDSGYDAIDYLIDNDPMDLAEWFRRALRVIEASDGTPSAAFLMDWDEATNERFESA